MGIVGLSFIINFPEIMDYKFTATMENSLDSIANGEVVWYEVLDKFYKKFYPVYMKVKDSKSLIEDKYERMLGEDP